MVSLVQLLQTVHDELSTVLANNTSVSNPDEHVDVLNRTKDYTTPFFGFEWQQNPVSRGTGGNREVEGITTNASGDTDGVNVSSDYELILDFGVIVDGDAPRQSHQYLGDIEAHFNKYVKNPQNLHADVQRVRDQGALPANLGDGRDTSLRKTYAVRYKSTQTESLPPAETVNWNVDLDIDTGQKDVYPEEY